MNWKALQLIPTVVCKEPDSENRFHRLQSDGFVRRRLTLQVLQDFVLSSQNFYLVLKLNLNEVFTKFHSLFSTPHAKPKRWRKPNNEYVERNVKLLNLISHMSFIKSQIKWGDREADLSDWFNGFRKRGPMRFKLNLSQQIVSRS